MKGCCQLQAKVCARLLVNCLFKLAQEKSVVRCPAMTIAVDMGRKATKTNKQTNKRIDAINFVVQQGFADLKRLLLGKPKLGPIY